MKSQNNTKYRLFRRSTGIYFLQDNQTGRQQSLKTREKGAAQALLHASNEAHRQPFLNLQLARTYLNAADPKMVTRTWQEVMEELTRNKRGSTQERYARAIEDRAFDPIRQLPVIESRSEHFLKVLANQRSSTNLYLRRIHNFALGMDWLLKPIIPRLEWPKVVYGEKRAITLDEHRRIIAREPNEERRNFYEMLWHLGGSQSDVANLHTGDIDWEDRTIGYDRCKTRNRPRRGIKPPIIHFGDEVAGILKRLPEHGPLFPYLRNVAAKYRSTEFHQRCAGLGIKGVSLHSYRYAWAERARKCGFPMRFAQEALGHNSKAVHAAYSSKAEVKVPSLDAWEREMPEQRIDGVTFQPSTKLLRIEE